MKFLNWICHSLNFYKVPKAVRKRRLMQGIYLYQEDQCNSLNIATHLMEGTCWFGEKIMNTNQMETYYLGEKWGTIKI